MSTLELLAYETRPCAFCGLVQSHRVCLCGGDVVRETHTADETAFTTPETEASWLSGLWECVSAWGIFEDDRGVSLWGVIDALDSVSGW